MNVEQKRRLTVHLHLHALRPGRVSLALVLVVLTTPLANAQKPFEYYAQRYDWRYAEPYIRIEQIDISISPERPRLEDEVVVKAKVTSPEDIFNLATVFEPSYGLGITSGREGEFCVAHYRQNETKECSTRVRFTSSPAVLQVRVAGRVKTTEGVIIPVEGMRGFRLEASEGDTGETGANVEFFQDPWLEFDPLTGERCRVGPAVAELNRKWISEVRSFSNSVSDLEALYLYRDARLFLVEPADESLFLYEDTGWKLVRGGAEFLLNRGWLKGFRREDRAYATKTPESIEKHTSWLSQKSLGGPEENKYDDSAIRWPEEYYGEKWERFDEPPVTEPPERAPYGSLEAKLEIDHAPALGETVRVTLTLSSYWDFPKVHIGIDVGRRRNVDRPQGIGIISWPEGFEIESRPTGDECRTYSALAMNERRTYEFTIRVSSEGEKVIGGGVAEVAPVERMIGGGDAIYLDVDVGEKETEISKEPFPPPPEYWATPSVQGTGPMMELDLMREGVDAFMKEAPGLTRWEARWLMDKVERSVVIEGIPYEEQVRKALKKVIEQGRHLARWRRISKLEAFRMMVEDWKKKRPKEGWGR
jgi:hypothetical protein